MEPNRLTIGLDSVSRDDVSRVGGKAATLGHLMQAGFDVPDGFVVTTEAFRLTVQSGGLSERLLPSDVEAAIRKELPRLHSDVAVRSSGVAEDTEAASYAGQYDTFLGVSGVDEVIRAVAGCMASAASARVDAYSAEPSSDMAVLIQRQVVADAAGVAFTADPLSGSRDEVLIHSVRGLSERLVSGQVDPDVWRVRSGQSECVENREESLTPELALEIASLAQSIEELLDGPQDVEWAVADGEVFVIQARPITALPDEVAWESQLPGPWVRNFRLGEWIGEPMTPLFDTWLLTRIEQGLFDQYADWFGARIPPPHHQSINGWYFGCLPIPRTLGGLIGTFAGIVRRALRDPRKVSPAFPQLARFGIERYVDDWRRDLLPGYRMAVAGAVEQVPGADPHQLISIVDDLARRAGGYFASLSVVGGYGWKTELPLADFYNEHLAGTLKGSHQTLLGGLLPQDSTPDHAVQGLDWRLPTFGEMSHAMPEADKGIVNVAEQRREAAEREARQALQGSSRLAGEFEATLSRAQAAARVRDEHVSQFTLPWPVMRSAARKLGQLLEGAGVLDDADDVFFLELDEVQSAITDRDVGSLSQTVDDRRQDWLRQKRLVPPGTLGSIPKMVASMFAKAEKTRYGSVPERSVRGEPASPGRVTGTARVITSLADSHSLESGQILVAPLTTPAWTPLFRLASAVVTDVGSVISHASLVAREYGIPAVVGTGDGTSRIRDGEIITVDGSAGYVQSQGDVL